MTALTAFESNLDKLIERDFDGNVSEAARQIGIARTQLNRYRRDNAWPHEAVLRRICETFNVDARILLEPLDQQKALQDCDAQPSEAA